MEGCCAWNECVLRVEFEAVWAGATSGAEMDRLTQCGGTRAHGMLELQQMVSGGVLRGIGVKQRRNTHRVPDERLPVQQ